MPVSLLADWGNFYVITGSSAAALTGLTFVVIALAANTSVTTTVWALHAFVTPTIVHFGGVLALAAFLSMPHQHVSSLSAGFGVAGLGGLTYTSFITVNMHRQRKTKAYVPVLEDWIWNVILPAVVSFGLLSVAILVWYRLAPALFAVATLSLMLLFIGIHNAWDIAVWMTTRKRAPP